MRRAIVTTTATAAGVVLLLSLKPHGNASAASAPIISSGSGTNSAANANAAQQPDSSASTPAASASSGSSGSGSGSSASGSKSSTGASKSGSFTGDAVDTRYGPVQVQLVVSGGKISNVNVLQYPNESQRDIDINSYALPTLNQEVLSQQNAQIQMVSGATYTSTGYIQSLQSALDAAGIK